MTLRTASKVDANQPEIVKRLRAVGATVLHLHQLKNCFDLLVGYRGRTFIMEVKDPAKPPSARKLTEGEEQFRDTWRGSPYYIIHTFDEALAIITAKEKTPEKVPPNESTLTHSTICHADCARLQTQ